MLSYPVGAGGKSLRQDRPRRYIALSDLDNTVTIAPISDDVTVRHKLALRLSECVASVKPSGWAATTCRGQGPGKQKDPAVTG